MDNNKLRIDTIIGASIKALRKALAGVRATERHPIVLETPVTIFQTIDGRGYLDFAYVPVVKVWHDRTTVVVEDDNGDTHRLVDSYETSGEHYSNAWWNAEALIDALTNENSIRTTL